MTKAEGPGRALLALAGALLAGACEGPPPETPKPASAPTEALVAEPPALDERAPQVAEGLKKTPSPEAPVDTSRWPAVPFGPEGALALVERLREASETPDGLRSWAARYAAYPFDVDGAEQAADLTALMKGLGEHLSDLPRTMAPFDVCEARSRAQLLGGEPVHFMDRLGGRPDAEELARDLDRMGLEEGRLLVNCYREAKAGFFLIVAQEGEEARVIAIRM